MVQLDAPKALLFAKQLERADKVLRLDWVAASGGED